jgi:hypothetical protein
VGAADPAAMGFIEHKKNFEDVVRSLKKRDNTPGGRLAGTQIRGNYTGNLPLGPGRRQTGQAAVKENTAKKAFRLRRPFA